MTRGPDTKVQVETHLTLSAVAFKIKTKNLTSGTKANLSTCQALKETLKESQINETHMKLFGREPMAYPNILGNGAFERFDFN